MALMFEEKNHIFISKFPFNAAVLLLPYINLSGFKACFDLRFKIIDPQRLADGALKGNQMSEGIYNEGLEDKNNV